MKCPKYFQNKFVQSDLFVPYEIMYVFDIML